MTLAFSIRKLLRSGGLLTLTGAMQRVTGQSMVLLCTRFFLPHIRSKPPNALAQCIASIALCIFNFNCYCSVHVHVHLPTCMYNTTSFRSISTPRHRAHPMDCEERLVKQAEMVKGVSPKTRVWVYRNLVKGKHNTCTLARTFYCHGYVYT